MFNQLSKRNLLATYLIVYFIILFIFSFLLTPGYDITHYYFPWSQHLQLSYFDGPPLIAYVIHAITLLFGVNAFSLNFVGVVFVALGSFAAYKIGYLLRDKYLGFICALIFAIYPFTTTRNLIIKVNYDGLENLLVLFTLYFALSYIKVKQIRYIYYLGISAGLLLLSKYSGVILVIALLIHFLTSKDLRPLFKTVHIYLAILLGLLLFSPVLIWNQQHHWQSFVYQLTSHNWHGGLNQAHQPSKYGFLGVRFYLISGLLGNLYIFLLLLIFVYFKNKAKFTTFQELFRFNNPQLQLIFTVCLTYMLFWLPFSYTSHIALNYLTPLVSIVIILTSYYLIEYKHDKLIYWLIIPVFFLIDIIILCSGHA